MNRIELCSFLKDVCRRVVVLNGEQVTSSGSGVVIDSIGTVLTARHVVVSGAELFPGQCFVSSARDGDPKPYHVDLNYLHEIDIGTPDVMRPIGVDLALLRPVISVAVEKSVALREDIPVEGTDVMMAGFPDDVLLPFHFDEHLETRNLDVSVAKKALHGKHRFFMRQLFCRQAMVGLTNLIHINKNLLATYMLDSGLTYGGSGGPVVDCDGKLIGIVIRKGLTSAKPFMIKTETADTLTHLPSTTGYALSHHFMFKLQELKKAQQGDGA